MHLTAASRHRSLDVLHGAVFRAANDCGRWIWGMDIKQLIDKAYQVFSKYKKPDYCTRYPDYEDYEFNQLLVSVTNRDLSMAHVGIPTWTPVSCLNSEALPYYMPRLIELAITKAVDRTGDFYLFDFINMFYEGPIDDRFDFFGPKQKEVMSDTFNFLCQNYSTELKQEYWLKEAKQGVNNWINT